MCEGKQRSTYTQGKVTHSINVSYKTFKLIFSFFSGPNWTQRNERLSRYRTRQLLIRSIWHKSWHVCEFNNHVVLIAPYSRQSKSILSPPHQGRCSLEWWGLPGGYIAGDCDFRWHGFELLMALRAIHCTFDRLVCDCTRYSIYCCVASDA